MVIDGLSWFYLAINIKGVTIWNGGKMPENLLCVYDVTWLVEKRNNYVWYLRLHGRTRRSPLPVGCWICPVMCVTAWCIDAVTLTRLPLFSESWRRLYLYRLKLYKEHRISLSFKPGFHYPSWRVTGFHYPSTRAVLTGARFPLAKLTSRQRSPVNSGL